MKSVAILAGALLGAVCAQDINSVPECGRTCITNMLAQQDGLGCPPVNGQPDPGCLCRNADFSYGLRDCSAEACGEGVAEAVVAYGVAYCKSAGVAIPTTGTTVASPSATGSASESGSASASGSATGESSAITTSSFATTITSDGSTITTSGATTIFGGGAASSAASVSSEASASASSVGESASSAASSIASSASGAAGSATSAAGSATSAAGSAASSAAGEATSSAFAPQMTAAPVAGLLAAAGVAAMLL